MALAELERLFVIKAPFREYIYVVPQFESLRDNPRFKVLLREIGLPRPVRVEK
jgi:hypothetical protein